MNNFLCTHLDAKIYHTSSRDGLIRCISCYKKFNRSTIEAKEKTKILNKKHSKIRYLKNKSVGFTPIHKHLNAIKKSARNRKLSFNIPLSLYKQVVVQNCYHCGISNTVRRINIDRINNSIGYEPYNIVPSCGPCNLIRSDKILFEEMPNIMQALHIFRTTGQKPPVCYFPLYTPLNTSRNRRSSGYTKLLNQARVRNKEVNITKEEYFEFVKDKNCHYCNSVLSISGCGLDRIDNNLPYLLDNVLTSCPICNDIRKNNLTVEETEVVIWTLCKLRQSKV